MVWAKEWLDQLQKRREDIESKSGNSSSALGKQKNEAKTERDWRVVFVVILNTELQHGHVLVEMIQESEKFLQWRRKKISYWNTVRG